MQLSEHTQSQARALADFKQSTVKMDVKNINDGCSGRMTQPNHTAVINCRNVAKYLWTKSKIIIVLSIFGSTYICERAFQQWRWMTRIRSRFHACLIDYNLQSQLHCTVKLLLLFLPNWSAPEIITCPIMVSKMTRSINNSNTSNCDSLDTKYLVSLHWWRHI